MKVIFYIASSINGCIADKAGNTDWSAEDATGFMHTCQAVGAVVMGWKTYEEYLALPASDWPNPAGPTVILTSRPSLPQNNFTTRLGNNPQGAIEIIENSGKSELVVIGGNQTWTSFMQAGLVDEIILDLEPCAIGNGRALFQGADFNVRLDLLATKALSPQTIQLHYRVIK